MKKLICIAALAGLVSATRAEDVENAVIYHNPKEFAGWPANEGVWSWGNEILVAFHFGEYEEREKEHSIGKNLGILFSRSLDGGKTWTTEPHKEIVLPKFIRKADANAVPSEGIDFASPGFAMKMRGQFYFTSADKGRNWSGPHLLPDFGNKVNSRTSYVVTGPKSCLFFITSEEKTSQSEWGRVFVAETKDGGKTFEFLSWIGDDLREGLSEEEKAEGSIFAIMPDVIRLDNGHLLCSIRSRIKREKWTDLYESADGGHSWTKLCELERGSSNPAALVNLGGESVAAVYGSRRKPSFGIMAKLSEDGGKTWSDQLVLRDDARKWDIGYARAVLRPDGTIVAAYYYTTEDLPENFIAATIWKPSRTFASAPSSKSSRVDK